MSRIYKGSTYHLQLLVSKYTSPPVEDIKISFYTTKPEDSVTLSEGIVVTGNIADVEISDIAFVALEEGVISYIVSGIRGGIPYLEERQSNYYLRNNSTSDIVIEPQVINIDDNGVHNIPIDAGVKEVSIKVDVPIQALKTFRVSDNMEYTFDADPEYKGMQKVNIDVQVPIQESKTLRVTDNGTYTVDVDPEYKGMKEVDVTVEVPIPVLEEGIDVRIYAGETGSIVPSEGFDAVKKVNYTALERLTVPLGLTFSASVCEEIDGGHLNWKDKYLWDETFKDCTNLKSIKNIQPADIWSMKGLFNNCKQLTDINFMKDWNIYAVDSLVSVFQSCEQLADINILSTWDVSNVLSMKEMFRDCKNIDTLEPLRNWDTSKVTDMEGLFRNCQKITSIDPIKNWNTSNVVSMTYLFHDCDNLESIDISNWDLSNVTNMTQMFSNNTKLREVKLGGSIDNLTSYSSMFTGIATTGTFYYPAEHDYSKIIAQLPSKWTAVPY